MSLRGAHGRGRDHAVPYSVQTWSTQRGGIPSFNRSVQMRQTGNYEVTHTLKSPPFVCARSSPSRLEPPPVPPRPCSRSNPPTCTPHRLHPPQPHDPHLPPLSLQPTYMHAPSSSSPAPNPPHMHAPSSPPAPNSRPPTSHLPQPQPDSGGMRRSRSTATSTSLVPSYPNRNSQRAPATHHRGGRPSSSSAAATSNLRRLGGGRRRDPPRRGTSPSRKTYDLARGEGDHVHHAHHAHHAHHVRSGDQWHGDNDEYNQALVRRNTELEARVEELQSDCDAFMEMAADERDETVRAGSNGHCSCNANLLTVDPSFIPEPNDI